MPKTLLGLLHRLKYSEVRFLLRFLLYKLRLGGRIRAKGLRVYLEPLVQLCVGKGGQIDLGNQIYLRKGCDLEAHDRAHLEIGDRFFANKGCSIVARDDITIGSDCMMGEYVTNYDHNHAHSSPGVPFQQQGYVSRPVKIGNNVWIGTKAFIGPGVTIGDNVVIGAHAVITKNVPPNTRAFTKAVLVVDDLAQD